MAKSARASAKAHPATTADERGKARSSFALSDDTREALEWIAEERRVSLSEALRRAIRTERYLVEQVSRHNAEIFIEIPGKRMKELVLV